MISNNYTGHGNLPKSIAHLTKPDTGMIKKFLLGDIFIDFRDELEPKSKSVAQNIGQEITFSLKQPH